MQTPTGSATIAWLSLHGINLRRPTQRPGTSEILVNRAALTYTVISRIIAPSPAPCQGFSDDFHQILRYLYLHDTNRACVIVSVDVNGSHFR
jgi:hypothetical protein